MGRAHTLKAMQAVLESRLDILGKRRLLGRAFSFQEPFATYREARPLQVNSGCQEQCQQQHHVIHWEL